MSSFQIALLAIFGAFAVAGILIFAFLVGGNSGNTIGAVTVWGTFDEVAVQTIIRQLSENDTRLRQVTYVVKNPETFTQELTNALASGTGPDLYIMNSSNSVVDAPRVAAIPYDSFTQQQFESLFVEAANSFMSPDGVLAVPVVVDPYVLYWNRDILSAAGFAKPPIYWDETFDMARAITDCQGTNAGVRAGVAGCDDTGSIQKATIAFGEYQNVDHAKDILALLIMQAGGPITTRDSAGSLSPSLLARTGEVAQPAESALNFYTAFANPSKDTYSWNRSLPSSRTMFANGDLALYVGLASENALIRKLNPNLNYAVAPVPQIRNINRVANAGVTYGFAVPRTSKNPQGALTVAYLLASPESSRALATVLGAASARRDVLAAPAEGSDSLIDKQALLVRSWEDPDPVRTDVIFRDMIESITSGAAKISEALQRAEQAMRQITTQ
jgi:ABC-type glycerol-3-phosphate transport system substrate-binding protein